MNEYDDNRNYWKLVCELVRNEFSYKFLKKVTQNLYILPH